MRFDAPFKLYHDDLPPPIYSESLHGNLSEFLYFLSAFARTTVLFDQCGHGACSLYYLLDIEDMDIVLNQHGQFVRKQKTREIRPAVDRFFDHIVERDCGQAEVCWIWQASELFRVNAHTLLRPWKFIYELMEGHRVPDGAGWEWSCPNPLICCQPEHLKYKGKYCQRSEG
jgi:hypothetical protein